MTPGAFLLRLRQRTQGGPKTTWYREVVRARILKAAPLLGTSDSTLCEVHLLTSKEDWLNACWAILSFYRASGVNYALTIHEDGTLPEFAHQTLSRLFPDARIIRRSEADAQVRASLANFPRSLAFHESNKLSLKVFDVLHYTRAPRVMLLDSDILFFSHPTELIRRIEDPSFAWNSANEDVASAYTVDAETVSQHCGLTLVDRFNSGLCIFHRESLRLDWFEEFLGIPGAVGHFWRIEQTLLALASSRFGCRLLPDEYKVRVEPGIAGRPVKHYVGAIRDLMYREGLASLDASGLLTSTRSSRPQAMSAEAVRSEH
ncbi:MAG: hypothetical protein ABL967_11140 [Bryobacteraceae bacterium]